MGVAEDPGTGEVAPQAAGRLEKIGRHDVGVIVGIHLPGELELFEIVEAPGAQGLSGPFHKFAHVFSGGQRWH